MHAFTTKILRTGFRRILLADSLPRAANVALARLSPRRFDQPNCRVISRRGGTSNVRRHPPRFDFRCHISRQAESSVRPPPALPPFRGTFPNSTSPTAAAESGKRLASVWQRKISPGSAWFKRRCLMASSFGRRRRAFHDSHHSNVSRSQGRTGEQNQLNNARDGRVHLRYLGLGSWFRLKVRYPDFAILRAFDQPVESPVDESKRRNLLVARSADVASIAQWLASYAEARAPRFDFQLADVGVSLTFIYDSSCPICRK